MGCAISLALAAAVAWSGVTPEKHIGGRKVSPGYLQGKVVLVDRWSMDCPPCRRALPRLEQVWRSYKGKPFVLLGSLCEGGGTLDAVRRQMEDDSLTYPMYEEAGLGDGEPNFDSLPFYYVVDATGRIVYRGGDGRRAEEAVVSAITNLGSPPGAAYWRRLVEFEKDVLPGLALLHITEFRKAFPKEAAQFDADFKALKARPGVEKLAKLEAASRALKDFDPTAKPAKLRDLLAKTSAAIKKYEPLKSEEDPVVSQEAKNCIADLMWTQAAIKAALPRK